MLRRWADVTARTITSVSTVRVWVSCNILVSQHLPGGIGFVYLLLHDAWNKVFYVSGHISADNLFVSDNGCCTSCQKMKKHLYRVFVNAENRGGGYISLSLFMLQPSSYLRDVHPTQLVCSYIAVVV